MLAWMPRGWYSREREQVSSQVLVVVLHVQSSVQMHLQQLLLYCEVWVGYGEKMCEGVALHPEMSFVCDDRPHCQWHGLQALAANLGPGLRSLRRWMQRVFEDHLVDYLGVNLYCY